MFFKIVLFFLFFRFYTPPLGFTSVTLWLFTAFLGFASDALWLFTAPLGFYNPKLGFDDPKLGFETPILGLLTSNYHSLTPTEEYGTRMNLFFKPLAGLLGLLFY